MELNRFANTKEFADNLNGDFHTWIIDQGTESVRISCIVIERPG